LNHEDLSSLLDNAADMGILGGSMDNKQYHSDRTMTNSDQSQQEEERPDAYVSVFDPVGEPAFKPSKTKPLPRWMNLLPNNVRREREQRPKLSLEHESLDSPEFEAPIEDKGVDPSDGSEDFPGSLIALDIPCLRGGGKASGTSTFPVSMSDKSSKPRKHNRNISFDSALTIDNTNSNDDHRCCRRAQTTSSVYLTPPEYPSYHPPPPRQRTPYPQDVSRLSSHQQEINSYFHQSESSTVVKEPIEEPCCELGAHLQSQKNIKEGKFFIEGRVGHTPPRGSFAFPTSSEDLNKYQSRSSRADKQKYAAENTKTIIDKMKRQKAGKHTMAKKAEDKAKKTRGKGSKSQRLGSEELELILENKTRKRS
jgi:hypothetical protein